MLREVEEIKMTTEQKNKILHMRRIEKKTLREIAKEVGYSKTMIEKFLDKSKKYEEYRVCVNCGSEFPVTSKMRGKKYCSPKCYKHSCNTSYERKKTLKCICECCGETFMAYSHRKRARFCSIQCRNKALYGINN